MSDSQDNEISDEPQNPSDQQNDPSELGYRKLPEEQQKTNIYCLALEDGFYYIGKSHNIESRYASHVAGDPGCMWTSLHKPVGIVESLYGVSNYEEDRMVKQYMGVYGLDKVRGGTYYREILSPDEIYFLNREIWSAQNRCVRCGRNNHFSKACHASTDIYGTVLYDPNEVCETCHNTGHKTSRCFAKT